MCWFEEDKIVFNEEFWSNSSQFNTETILEKKL